MVTASTLKACSDLATVRAELLWRDHNRIAEFFPDEGPFRRELYKPHCEFFAAGAKYRTRLLLAGNRTGKTVAGAYELATHLTGQYPSWWTGKRFTAPVKAVAASDTGKLTREVVQQELLGQPGRIGTGMVPYDAITKTTMRGGVTDAVDTCYVKHISGGYSTLIFKSYEQGRESFQGLSLEVAWCDEELSSELFDEILTRTATTSGVCFITFTPLQGLTPLIQRFLPGGVATVEALGGTAHVTTCTWDEIPHLSEETKQELLSVYPPYQRAARSKGVPTLGAGAIYAVLPEEDIVVPDFAIPDHWPRAYGLDVGWSKTAAVFCAKNRDTDTLYIYAEHYRGEAEPVIHAEAIKARGAWIPGAIDPAARGRSQVDGRQLLQMYQDLGLHLTDADNAVESGIYQILMRQSTGRLKVFRSCQNFMGEWRLYRRDEKGRIIKENDHGLDALRYVHSVWDQIAKPVPAKPKVENVYVTPSSFSTGWMG